MTTKNVEETPGNATRQLHETKSCIHAFSITFTSDVIVIDLEHLEQCGQRGHVLLETLETTTHEYAHFKHPRWHDRRVEQWWRTKVRPNRELLEKFVMGLNR